MGCKGMNGKNSFRVCEKCGKKLIQRLSNGMWSFQFGRKVPKEGECTDNYVLVEIYFHGSLKMKCLNRVCSHWNIFHFFPNFRGVEYTQSPTPKANDNRRLAEEVEKELESFQEKTIGKEVIENGS